MYVLMYAMVDRMDNVVMNVNQLYMAALMAAPMVVIELVVMRGMYRDPEAKRVLCRGSSHPADRCIPVHPAANRGW